MTITITIIKIIVIIITTTLSLRNLTALRGLEFFETPNDNNAVIWKCWARKAHSRANFQCCILGDDVAIAADMNELL